MLSLPFHPLDYYDGLFYRWPLERGSAPYYCSVAARTLGYPVFIVGSDNRCYASNSIESVFAATRDVPCPDNKYLSFWVYRPYRWPESYNNSFFMVYQFVHQWKVTYNTIRYQTGQVYLCSAVLVYNMHVAIDVHTVTVGCVVRQKRPLWQAANMQLNGYV